MPTKKMSLKGIVEKLKAVNPVLYQEIIERNRGPTKKFINKWSREARRLVDGKNVTLSVMKKTFQVEAHLYWGGTGCLGQTYDCAEIEIVSFRPNRKASQIAEKNLLSFVERLCNHGMYEPDNFMEDLREDVSTSKDYKMFSEKIMVFLKEMDEAAAEFNFDYNRDIGIEFSPENPMFR